MGSIGWFILGYAVLGCIMPVVIGLGTVFAAVLRDWKRWSKKDKESEAEFGASEDDLISLEALIETAKRFNEANDVYCSSAESPAQRRFWILIQNLWGWPYIIPVEITELWKRMKSLEAERMES